MRTLPALLSVLGMLSGCRGMLNDGPVQTDSAVTTCPCNDGQAPCACDAGDETTPLQDETPPSVASFAATNGPNGTVAISWTANDTGGSHLDAIAIYRATDSSDAPGTWQEVVDLRTTVGNQSIDTHTTSTTDTPGNGIWWYSLRVSDRAGNVAHEPTSLGPIRVVVDEQPEPVEIHYVSQTGDNDQNGTSPTHAWSMADLDKQANWHTIADKDKRIGPGDTVRFIGEISSPIVVLASGTESAYITLDGTDAFLTHTDSYWGRGLISVVDRSYLRIVHWTIDANYTVGTASQAAIYLEGTAGHVAEYIIIDRNDVTKAVNGIWANNHVTHLTITRNNFHELSGSGLRKTQIDNKAGRGQYISFGGSLGFGNVCRNVGHLDSYFETNSCVHLDQTSDFVVSRNHMYADKEYWGMSGLYLNECTSGLIQYNVIHDMRSEHHRSGVGSKGDQRALREGPLIYRFNHVYGCYSDFNDENEKNWGAAAGGLHASYDFEHAYIYGNYSHHNGSGLSFSMATCSGVCNSNCPGCDSCPNSSQSCYEACQWNTNGINPINGYIFGNIVYATQFTGIGLGGKGGTDYSCLRGGMVPYDALENLFIFNNTIYQAGTHDTSLGFGYNLQNDSATRQLALLKTHAPITANAGQQINVNVFNNLIVHPRPAANDGRAMFVRRDGDAVYDYQHYHTPGVTPQVHYTWWDGTNQQASYDWNSSSRPTRDRYGFRDGTNDTTGDPHFNDPAGGDFSLTARTPPAIRAHGRVMGTGSIHTVTIQGVDHAIPWGFALGPNTVFHDTDPDKIVIHQGDRNVDGWGKGAYVYGIASD